MAIRLIPGDPALMYAGNDATPETLAAIRERFGLNEPIWTLYLIWWQCAAGAICISMLPACR